MPTDSGRQSLMDAILAGEKPANFLSAKPECDWIGDGTHSPIDGSFHRSKDSYLSHLKQNGCHINDDSIKSRREKRERAASAQKRQYEAAKVEAAKLGVTSGWESTD